MLVFQRVFPPIVPSAIDLLFVAGRQFLSRLSAVLGSMGNCEVWWLMLKCACIGMGRVGGDGFVR